MHHMWTSMKAATNRRSFLKNGVTALCACVPENSGRQNYAIHMSLLQVPEELNAITLLLSRGI
jgi:hypothetical protein